MRWLPLVLVLVGCGAASPVAPIVPVSTPEPSPRPVYSFDRWAEGVPLRACAPVSVDSGLVSAVVSEMSRVSGLPLAQSGPCTVEWIVAPAEYKLDAGGAYCDRAFDGHAITSAKLVFRNASAANDHTLALHEAGHALGLVHSSDRHDLMYPTPEVDDFSAVELDLLRSMYK